MALRLKTDQELEATGWTVETGYNYYKRGCPLLVPEMREKFDKLPLHDLRLLELGEEIKSSILGFRWHPEMFVKFHRGPLRLKTPRELEAEGWVPDYIHPGDYLPPEGMVVAGGSIAHKMFVAALDLERRDIEILRKNGSVSAGVFLWDIKMFTDAPTPVEDVPGDNHKKVKHRRLKNANELRASGWRLTDGGWLPPEKDPVNTFGLLPSMERKAGTLRQIHIKEVLEEGQGEFLGYIWTRGMFIDTRVGLPGKSRTEASTSCECAKEKFGFMFHERWCPSFVHPFAVATAVAADVPAGPPPTHQTAGDIRGMANARDLKHREAGDHAGR